MDDPRQPPSLNDYQMITVFGDETSASNGRGDNDRIVAIVQGSKAVFISLVNRNESGSASGNNFISKMVIVKNYEQIISSLL